MASVDVVQHRLRCAGPEDEGVPDLVDLVNPPSPCNPSPLGLIPTPTTLGKPSTICTPSTTRPSSTIHTPSGPWSTLYPMHRELLQPVRNTASRLSARARVARRQCARSRGNGRRDRPSPQGTGPRLPDRSYPTEHQLDGWDRRVGCGHLIKRTAPVSNKLRPPGTQQLRDPCGPATPGLYRSVTGLRNSVTVGPATPTGHITDDTVPQRRCDSQTPRDPERHCSPMTGHTPSYGPPADWRMGRGRGAPLHVRANPPATHGPTRVGGRVCRMGGLPRPVGRVEGGGGGGGRPAPPRPRRLVWRVFCLVLWALDGTPGRGRGRGQGQG